MNRRPFCVAVCAFSAATLLCHLSFDSFGKAALVPAAGVVFFLMGLYVKRSENRKKALALLLLGAASGAVLFFGYSRLVYFPAAGLANRGQTLELVAIETAQSKTRYGQVTVRIQSADGARLMGTPKAILYLSDGSPDIRPGDRISGRFYAGLPEVGLDFDTFAYLKSKGVFLELSQLGNIAVERGEHVPPVFLPTVFAEKFKAVFPEIMPEDEAAFATALVTGDKSRLNYQIKDAFSMTGTSHIVAVSGMHMSFLVGFLLLFGKRIGAVLAVPAVIFFMFMTGLSPSVTRAGVMNLTLLLAFFLKREQDAPNAMALSLLLILLRNPYAISDVGCVLSFSSTAGILLFSGKISRFFTVRVTELPAWLHRPVRTLSGLVATTVGASVLTLPLTAFYFGRISLISPIVNLIVVPLVSMAFTMSALTGLLGMVFLKAGMLLSVVLKILLSLILWIVRMFAALPYAAVPANNFYFLTALVIAYGAFMLYTRRTGHFAASAKMILSAAALALAFAFSGITAHKEFSITLFNAAGPAVAAQSGSNLILVDCGPALYGSAEKKIYSELSLRGVYAAALVITSVEDVYAGAAPGLIGSGRIKNIVLPESAADPALYQAILEAAGKTGVPVHYADGPVSIADISVIPHPLSGGERVLNIRAGNLSVLSAYVKNPYLIYKAWQKAPFPVDLVLLDLSAISRFPDFCARLCDDMGAGLLAVPDRLYTEIPASALTDTAYLFQSGSLVMKTCW